MADPTSAKPTPLRRRILFTLLALSLVLGACVLITEVALRALAKPETQHDGDYVIHAGYYTFTPETVLTFTTEHGDEIRFATDEYGLRNPPGALAKSDVIVLGDSFVAGVNTADGDTFVDHLANTDLNVYNAGMNGFSTVQALALSENLLNHASPQHIVLMFYLGNDFRDNYRYRTAAVLASTPTTSATHPSWTSSLTTTAANIAAKSAVVTALYKHVYLGWIRGMADDPMASYSLAELAAMKMAYGQGMTQACETTRQALAALKTLAQAHGAALHVVGLPSKAQVVQAMHEINGFQTDPRTKDHAIGALRAGFSFDRPDQTLADLTRQLDIDYTSLLAVFRNHAPRTLYGQIDVHWTSAAQQLAAQHVAHALTRQSQ